jgi:endonuclease III
MGPKSTALLLWAAFEIRCGLPVDSHVLYAFKAWGWTNALTADECSWQAAQWLPSEDQIKTNDVIGSIRQQLVSRRPHLLRMAKRVDDSFFEKIDLL